MLKLNNVPQTCAATGLTVGMETVVLIVTADDSRVLGNLWCSDVQGSRRDALLSIWSCPVLFEKHMK